MKRGSPGTCRRRRLSGESRGIVPSYKPGPESNRRLYLGKGTGRVAWGCMEMDARRENARIDSRDLHRDVPNCMESGYELDTFPGTRGGE